MILRGLKNFAKSIKYYFTPLGMLAIFTTLALTIALTGITNSVKVLFNELAQTVGSTSIDWAGAGNSIWKSITSLNWDVAKLVSYEWITTTLNDALVATGLSEAAQQAATSVTTCAGKIIGFVIVGLVLFVLGIVLGYIVLYFQVRSNLMKTKWWKTILYGLFDILIQIGLIVLAIVLIRLWLPFIFIFLLLGFILTEMISVIQAYVLHGIKKIKFKEIFTPKVIGLSALSDAIIFISGLATIILLAFIFQPVVGIVIGLPLIEISIICSRFSAESYVVDKLDGTYDKEEKERLVRKQARKEKRAQKKEMKKGNA